MQNKLPLLKVCTFGKERITYGDEPIMSGRGSFTKVTKLLMILIYNGKSGIARNKLLEELYGREELADVSNNFRVTTHRLKKMLIESGLPEYEYIVLKKGVYYWNSPMETVVDAQVFEELIAKAKEEDGQQKIELLKEAIEMYKGDFLPKLSGEEWVVLESVKYKELYSNALEEVCTFLKQQREYEEILRLVEPACEMYPFDEWQAHKIECYIAMNRYKDALKEYEETAKLLFEELGITPSEKMMEQFKEMSKHISNRPQIINEIKSGLQEETAEKGAFFCTVPGFRDAYRIVRRGMERNGQSVFLMVCTLTDGKGHPLGNSERLNMMSDELFSAIKGSLRRCDSFTKYNPSQYLVMLMGTNEENCQIVIDRISKNFTKNHKTWAEYLNCSVSSLYDMEYEI